MKQYDLLVIGGVAAGMSAASQARRVNKDITIGVFEKGGFISYGACGMPYYISDQIVDHRRLIAINKDDYILKRRIDIFTGAEVIEVDLENRSLRVAFKDKEEIYTYKKLVISTGAKPFIPPIEGIENDRVFILRNLSDGIRIKEFIQKNFPRSAVLIGGGFIGLEMAESMRELGIECTVLEKMESVAMTMGSEIREKIMSKLKENGVNVFANTDISRIAKDENRLNISIKDRDDIDADFIIASIGVLPNTDLLKESGLNMNERGAIIINEKSETNINGVYAAGDCATVKHLITGKDVYMPLGTTANKQGRVAGLQAAGVETEIFRGIVGTQLVKVFDLEIGKTGFSEADAERNGINAESAKATWKDIAGYCPASESIFIKITINTDTREVIGGQVIGRHGAALRTNVIATAISAGMKIEEFAYLDLGYAPPFAPVWDSLLVAAQKLVRR